MPDAQDWATALVFQPANALDTWAGLLRGVESVDFREVPSDVVGHLPEAVGPDERHRYGQHFTGDDVVDLINSFCIQCRRRRPRSGLRLRQLPRPRLLPQAHWTPGGPTWPDRRAVRLRHLPLPRAPGDAEPGRPRNQRRGELPAHRPAKLLRLHARRTVLRAARRNRRAARRAAAGLGRSGREPTLRPPREEWRSRTRPASGRCAATPGPACADRAQRPPLLLLAGGGPPVEIGRVLRLPDQLLVDGRRVRLRPARVDAVAASASWR